MADSASELEPESDASSVDGVPSLRATLSTCEHLQRRVSSLQQENCVLKTEVETLKLKIKAVQGENDQIRRDSVSLQVMAEQEEEYISNTLLKKITELKKEKESLALNYEHEEEFLTNDLSRKLSQLRKEKDVLEQQLEKEQEAQVTKLMHRIEKLETDVKHKQDTLDRLRREKVELENALEQEQEALVNRLWKKMEKLETEKKTLRSKLDMISGSPSSTGLLVPGEHSRSNSQSGSMPVMPGSGRNRSRTCSGSSIPEARQGNSPIPAAMEIGPEQASPSGLSNSGLASWGGITESMSSYVSRLRLEVSRLQTLLATGREERANEMAQLEREERVLAEENIRLKKRLQREVERRRELCRQMSESESSLEMDDERHFNEASRGVLTIATGATSSHSPGPQSISPMGQSGSSSPWRACRECGQSLAATVPSPPPGRSPLPSAGGAGGAPQLTQHRFAKPTVPSASSPLPPK